MNRAQWLSTPSCYSLAHYWGESEWNSTLIPPVWRRAVPDLGVFNSLGVIRPQMSLSVWPVPYLHIMRGLRARAVITQQALYLTTSNNCYCRGVTVSIITRFIESVGILIQVSMLDPQTWLHDCLNFVFFFQLWAAGEKQLSYRDASVLSSHCLGFVKFAAARLKRAAQLLLSASVALLCTTAQEALSSFFLCCFCSR